MRCGSVEGVKAALTDGFDFSSTLPTPLEAGLLGFPSHTIRAAGDNSVTVEQVLNVVRVGIPIEKDFPGHRSRTAGISFERRAGGTRRVRVKVSWNDHDYVVTVHSVKRIKRRTAR